MGELRNCPVCGKVFVKMSKNLCPDCIEKEENEFKEVRTYLKDNPGASVGEIAQILSIDEDKILKWVREGRIEASYLGDGMKLTCKRCGQEITIGNLCSKCAQLFARELKSVSQSAPAKEEEAEKPREAKSAGMAVAEKLRKDD